MGRFAPSPSGALHFGSLVAALGSYLHARACRAQWRVRIDDIDPPREVPGAADTLLRQLRHYGLHWDGPVMYQRHEAYLAALARLHRRGLSHYCDCTRSRIQSLGDLYDGHCRDRHLSATGAAIPLQQTAPVCQCHFHDKLRGRIDASPALSQEDFIIRRRDGVFAYNLAVVEMMPPSASRRWCAAPISSRQRWRQLALYRQFRL